jgi:hypothetical protein
MTMINAKDELLKHVGSRIIKCTTLTNGYEVSFRLKCGYAESEYTEFLNHINFKYNNSFGGQNLYGTIWYSDGSWSERGEYDGSEWWEHRVCPQIPVELKYGA